MTQLQAGRPEIEVAVENVGGIASTEVTLPPGVSVLKGQNASNRTSFLQAIMAAMGSDRPSLKADATTGSVTLSMGEETYTRRFERTETGVRASGDPYLKDPTAADAFAFLLESNPARRAVLRQSDLRSVIMAPIDTTEIQAEITQLQARKQKLDDELAELDSLRDRQPDLAERQRELEEEIASVESDLESVRAEIEAAEADLAETRETKSTMEDAFERLQELRADHSQVTDRLANEQESLSAARDERESVKADLASLSGAGEDRREELSQRLSARRREQSQLESAVSELQNLVQFNEDLLEGEETIFQELGAQQGDVTERLVEDESVTCWTCGTTVDRSQITGTVDRLRELRSQKLDRIGNLDDEIETLEAELEELEEVASRRESLQSDLDQLETEIDSRSETIETLTDRRDELATEIERTEAEIESLEFAEQHEDLLALHQRENELELERDRLAEELESVESELESLEAELDRQSDLEDRRKSVTDELTDLRTRVERIEREAVEEFNDRMASILEIMGYTNVARIWIERRDPGPDQETVFDLHVVRSDEAGTAYEDSLAHLSESEREVTGLIFALAGYLVHDVPESVPFMLLDSVEALDSDRIARLVEYFEDHVPYLVVALLPEDARALDDHYPRITEI